MHQADLLKELQRAIDGWGLSGRTLLIQVHDVVGLDGCARLQDHLIDAPPRRRPTLAFGRAAIARAPKRRPDMAGAGPMRGRVRAGRRHDLDVNSCPAARKSVDPVARCRYDITLQSSPNSCSAIPIGLDADGYGAEMMIEF